MKSAFRTRAVEFETLQKSQIARIRDLYQRKQNIRKGSLCCGGKSETVTVVYLALTDKTFNVELCQDVEEIKVSS